MDKTVISLPVSSGNRLEIKNEKLKTLKQQFPLVDVEEELRELGKTLEVNPKFIRCRSGTPAFYIHWLQGIQKRREKCV